MKKYYDYDELSEVTGIPKATLYSMVYRKQIPIVRLSSRMVLFDIQEIDAWLAAHRVPVAASESLADA